jgi:hypothetical protein
MAFIFLPAAEVALANMAMLQQLTHPNIVEYYHHFLYEVKSWRFLAIQYALLHPPFLIFLFVSLF